MLYVHFSFTRTVLQGALLFYHTLSSLHFKFFKTELLIQHITQEILIDYMIYVNVSIVHVEIKIYYFKVNLYNVCT